MACSERTSASSDVIRIAGGTVIDGTGAEPLQADVIVENGRIVEVGRVGSAEGIQTLDVSGHYVSPGFIDVHGHSDFTLFVDPRAVSAIAQGVTTEIFGNCGHGCFPIVDPQAVQPNIYGCKQDHDIPWRTAAEYLEILESARPAINVATLVPNGNLRLAAVESLDRPSNPRELEKMKNLLSECLEQGAIGFSTGLEYGFENACSEDEIVELCKVTAKAGGIYACHTRHCEGQPVETNAEAIRTAAKANIPLQISHIGSTVRLVPTDRIQVIEQAMEQVEAARRRGQDVTFDQHTRLFGIIMLMAGLPQSMSHGSNSEIAERLKDPAAREKARSHRSVLTSLAAGDWSNIVVFAHKSQPELIGRSIQDISTEARKDPWDTIFDLLLSDIDHVHELMVIGFAYREEYQSLPFRNEYCMPASDATALAPDGPLRDDIFHGSYTWASWFYRYFVRDKGLLRPQDAIRQMTSFPAEKFGLRDRGIIRKGAWADLAVFDPRTFAERGTTFEPNQLAVGMKHVLVNGVIALKDGLPTGKRGGGILRHGESTE